MSALDNQKPVSLSKDDDYYKLLNEICESLKQEIIKPTEQIDPEKEREKILKRRDENERLVSNEKVNPNSLPIEIQI